jgi:hypothetical protein
MADPAHPFYFATKAEDASGGGAGAGIWSPMGVVTDGTSLYFATGNSHGTYPTDWKMAYTESAFRLDPTLKFDPTVATSYFVPSDWLNLDFADTDISGSGVALVELPGTATPHVEVVLAKSGKAYVLDRDHLAGVTTADPPSTMTVAGGEIITAPSSYTTAQGAYVAYTAVCPGTSTKSVNAIKVSAGASGPTATHAWCAPGSGGGAPIVTVAGNDVVVWYVSTEGENATADQKLHGFDGDTGAEVATSAALGSGVRFSSPMVAKGRVYFAGDGQLYSIVIP